MEKEKNKENITRKEALKRMGKYATLTAIGTFLILNPKQAQAGSQDTPPDGGGLPW